MQADFYRPRKAMLVQVRYWTRLGFFAGLLTRWCRSRSGNIAVAYSIFAFARQNADFGDQTLFEARAVALTIRRRVDFQLSMSFSTMIALNSWPSG